MSAVTKRVTRQTSIGHVILGGKSPVVIQSMTNTDTADYLATAIQCAELARAGSELVRITVNSPEAAAAVPKIREDRKSTRLNSSHLKLSRMPSSA